MELLIPRTAFGDGFNRVIFLADQLLPTPNPCLVQRSGLDCRQNRAARFTLVRTIVELTGQCQIGNVLEHRIHSLPRIDQSQGSHPRCVDQPAARNHPVHRSCGGRVHTLGVIFTNAFGKQFQPRHRVGNRRFSNTGRPDKRHRLPSATPRCQMFDCVASRCIDRDCDHILQLARLIKIHRRVIAHVHFGQHHNGFNIRLMGQRHISFQPCDVEIRIARRHDKQRVDIGRDKLCHRLQPCRAALDQAFTFQNALHLNAIPFGQNPVTYGHAVFNQIAVHGKTD